MRYLGVFGSPIRHSLSPLLHNAVLQSYNLPYCYGRYELTARADTCLESRQDSAHSFSHLPSHSSQPARSNPLLDAFYALNLHGANITLPFKELAFASATRHSALAYHIGAVNTLVRSSEGLLGYNTDAPGFLASLLLGGFSTPKMPDEKLDELAILSPLLCASTSRQCIDSALIIGAGGSAKALAVMLHLCGVELLVANRSNRAREFFATRGIPYCTFDELDSSKPYTLIINATSASIGGELPLGALRLGELFSHAKIAYDLMYGHELPFVGLARSCGIACQDGADMLILQAACALMLFCPELAGGDAYGIKQVFAIMQSVFPRASSA